MKKLFLLAIIMSLLIPIGSTAEKTIYDDQTVLYSIMDNLNARYLEEDIMFNGVIFNNYTKFDELDKIAEEIKTEIGILGVEIDSLVNEKYNYKYYTKEIIVEEDFGQISYIGQDKEKNNIAIILSSYNNKHELTGETYAYVNIVKSSDFFKKNDIIERIKSIYNKYNSKVEITSCLLGEISNNMSYNDKVKEIKRVLKKVNGNIVDEFSDQSLISYTIYTPYIGEHIKIGKDRINLNLAIRYNEIEGKNYIWLGTPIITVGY